MEQLNLYDYYENLAKNQALEAKEPVPEPKKPPLKKAILKPKVLKKQPKPPKVKPPDVLFSIGKKTLQGNITIDDAFFPWGDLGLAKLALLRRSGLDGMLPDVGSELFRGIKYVRGQYEEKFRNLSDSIVTFSFNEPAAKRMKSLEKEYRRRNIRLKVDVDISEVGNV
ncbi:MAG: hypothetical protein C0402_05425 [Thermodesulfovibrio sp.]|nr:hypothetical protein [Thermodesulfovibrio sp.]